jgi:epoxyqueuosine reductase
MTIPEPPPEAGPTTAAAAATRPATPALSLDSAPESLPASVPHPASADTAARLARFLRGEAARLGFSAVGIAPAASPPGAAGRLAAALAAGHHAGMAWLAEAPDRRADPARLWPEARSAVVLGLDYGPDGDALANLARPEIGNISVYARGRDYHDVIKGKLKELAGRLVARAAALGVAGDVKVFVDTAPVMEKPLAAMAGLGWQGRHTNLVSRDAGSWLFLGVVLTTLDLAADPPARDRCGSCRACLDVCPTGAFPAPYRLDAGRCISYLTIEHAGPIPPALRPAIGNRIYGCDDCLAVCPWNKFARIGREARLAARDENVAPPLADLAALDDAGFRRRFSASPVKRVGRDRFVRNVLVAIGNSGRSGLVPAAHARLDDPSPLVRGAAVWALSRLLDPAAWRALAAERVAGEGDADVRAEWGVDPGSSD